MKYHADITPALINKTAIYNIITDTLREIPDLNLKKLVISKPYQGDSTFKAPPPKLFILALRLPRLFIFFRSILVFFLPKETRSILFFDPLYILFYRQLVEAKVMVLDLTPITFPEWHNKKVAYLYKEAFKLLNNQGIICLSISQSTKIELDSIFKIPPERSKVIYLYSHSKYKPLDAPASTKNILFVGSFEPRKNLLGLLKGFHKSGLAEQGYKLHIVGAKTQHFEDNKVSIEELKNVIIHGYLSDENLLNIYKNTRIFAYPTFWEGFGVPLLEAINLKIAAFASNQSACPEIGGPDMKYVNPYCSDEISATLTELSKLSDNEYIQYTEKIYIHASQFNIQSYIQNIKNILDS